MSERPALVDQEIAAIEDEIASLREDWERADSTSSGSAGAIQQKIERAEARLARLQSPVTGLEEVVYGSDARAAATRLSGVDVTAVSRGVDPERVEQALHDGTLRPSLSYKSGKRSGGK